MNLFLSSPGSAQQSQAVIDSMSVGCEGPVVCYPPGGPTEYAGVEYSHLQLGKLILNSPPQEAKKICERLNKRAERTEWGYSENA